MNPKPPCGCDTTDSILCTPYHCDRVKPGGAPYTIDQCRVCWLYLYDPLYRGDKPVAETPMVPSAILTPSSGFQVPQRLNRPVQTPPPPAGVDEKGIVLNPLRTLPCFYLGEVLEKKGECPKCWVRKCSIYQKCTTGQYLQGLMCCQSCPDYETFS